MIQLKNVLISILISLLPVTICHSQSDSMVAPKYFTVEFIYGGHIPGGDMADRFGSNFQAGLGLSYIARNGFNATIRGTYLFGNQVKEDVLSSIRTPEGFLIGNNMGFASVFLRQRGIHLHLEGGKLLRLNAQKNQQAGIKLAGGIGTLIHKIRVVDDFDSAIQISGAYRKGYDRLTMGFSLMQFAGYHHIDKEGLLNFSIGIEAVQGFTRSLRKFNYDTARPDKDQRIDLLFGIRLAWLLPFQIGSQNIYY